MTLHSMVAKVGDKPFLKLSTNELDNAVKNERNKWRIFRIQQVRAQANEEASRIRYEFRKEGEKQKLALRRKEEQNWQKENRTKLDELEGQYKISVNEFGEAHRRALKEIEEAKAIEEQKNLSSKLATERGKKAMQLLANKQAELREKDDESSLQRQKFQLKEKRRAYKIAKLPTPTKFKPKKKIVVKPPKKVAFYEAGTFTTSSYIPRSVKVQKEEPIEKHTNAKEAAEWIVQEEEQLEIERELKLNEQKKKIEERGIAARKREQVKEMYSHLMEELGEADNHHQLSDFLNGDECEDVSVSKEILNQQEMQKKAEKKVKDIFLQYDHNNATDDPDAPLEQKDAEAEPSSSTIGAVNQPVEKIFDVIFSTKECSNRSEEEDTSNKKEKLVPYSLSNSSAIHFKETVPIDKLPILKEKFIVKHYPSPSTAETASESHSESSYDELMVKITVDQFSSDVSSSSEKSGNVTKFSTSYETEYAELSNKLKNKLIQVRSKTGVPREKIKTNQQADNVVSDVSSSSTEYMKLPDSVPVRDTDDDSVWLNLKQILESRKKIQEMIKQLNEKSGYSKQRPEKKIFKTFKTPPRIYTEKIKTTESGKRPVSKKEKFEQQKKVVLEHYVKRLIHMKQDELKQISASSVESSGINLSSSGYLTELSNKIKKSVCPPSNISIATFQQSDVSSAQFNSSSTIYNDIDTLPSKLSGTTLSSASHQTDGLLGDESLPRTPFSSVGATNASSSKSSVPVSLEDNEYQAMRRQQIYMRLLQLQTLKQQLLLGQASPQHQEETISQSPSKADLSKSYSPQNYIEKRVETTLDWSAASTYQTPSREDSTLSSTTRVSSSSKLIHEHNLPDNSLHALTNNKFKVNKELDQNSDQRTVRPLSVNLSDHRQEDSFINIETAGLQMKDPTLGNNTSQENYYSRENELLSRLNTSIENWMVEHRNLTESESTPNDIRESEPSSSPVSSIPDMTLILKKFGLGWAQSMIRKMDIAEENFTSDSSKS